MTKAKNEETWSGLSAGQGVRSGMVELKSNDCYKNVRCPKHNGTIVFGRSSEAGEFWQIPKI